MKKLKFVIGQPVLVNLNHQVKAGYEDDHRLVMKEIEWRKGQQLYPNTLEQGVITGMKQFWEGEYQPESQRSNYFGYEEDYSPAYCSQDKQVVVWCVRLGYLNKELYFFERDIQQNGDVHEFFKGHICYPMPLVKAIPKKWSGGWSVEMRMKVGRESKGWPRDSKGRFCK